jgi:hypothetical protein
MDDTPEKPADDSTGDTQINTPVAKVDDNGDSARNTKKTETTEAPRPDPTRFGDWEKNGRCIDF